MLHFDISVVRNLKLIAADYQVFCSSAKKKKVEGEESLHNNFFLFQLDFEVLHSLS